MPLLKDGKIVDDPWTKVEGEAELPHASATGVVATVEVATCKFVAGLVVPIPTNPAALIVMPEEVALKAPPGIILNLSASESSTPIIHLVVVAV